MAKQSWQGRPSWQQLAEPPHPAVAAARALRFAATCLLTRPQALGLHQHRHAPLPRRRRQHQRRLCEAAIKVDQLSAIQHRCRQLWGQLLGQHGLPGGVDAGAGAACVVEREEEEGSQGGGVSSRRQAGGRQAQARQAGAHPVCPPRCR